MAIVHLALGRRGRLRQLDFLSEQVSGSAHVVIMGDLNCGCESREIAMLRDWVDLQEAVCDQGTFPSWRPVRRLDHILVSGALRVENARVLDYPFSDHLPIGLDILLPGGMDIAA
ncbi:MAG: endonuclease/exonuclease/phosphatase family protein [Candidatus Sedimenticola endophacoides]